MVRKAGPWPKAKTAPSNGRKSAAKASNGSSSREAPAADAASDPTPANIEPRASEPRDPSPIPKKRDAPEASIEQEPRCKKTKQECAPSTPKKNESPVTERFPSPPSQQATEFDKEAWQGFCEIESEPALFSVILREMGVQGVTVREVFALDPEFITDSIPQPTFGLILLFRHRLDDSAREEKTCPANIWFANQMPAQNSCATLAMIQILMNNSAIDIGEHLTQFKLFTENLTPFQRGEAFASFRFVKKIHNSFAKKMDILENDKYLAYKVHKADRSAATKSRRNRRYSTGSDDSTNSFEDSAHHFIAFVPVAGEVWKLDGMDVQPTKIAAYDADKPDEWIASVSDKVNAIMAAGGNDYNIIALAQSPLVSRRRNMCLSVNTTQHVESRLDALNADWRAFLYTDDGSAPSQPPTPTFLSSLGISEDDLAVNPVPDDVKAEVDADVMPSLLDRREKLCAERMQLQMDILDGMAVEAEEDGKARDERWDYGPLIKRWLEMLAENGYLEENLHRFLPGGSK